MNTALRFFLLPLLLGGTVPLPLLRAAQGPVPTQAQKEPAGETALKVYRTAPVYFPPVLLRSGITHGEAQVVVAIDADGKITDALLAAYTQEPFGQSALEAIRKWRFDAPRVKGDPAASVVDFQIRFEAENIVVIERIGQPVFSNENFAAEFAYKPQDLRALDTIPTPVHVEQPVYPKEWSAQGMHGKVTIDFYIDETGAVRMPSVLSVTEYPLLAAAATTAVREWRFAPPVSKGRPVLAHCQQVFTFERETSK